MTKSLLLTLFVSITLNGLLGYLSYSFYSDKAIAESQLEVAVASNKFMAVSLERKSTVCTLQDKIATENQTEQLLIVKEKDTILDAIGKMVVVPTVLLNASKGTKNVNETTTTAGMDDVLPEPLRLLLQDSCNRSKGSSCIQP